MIRLVYQPHIFLLFFLYLFAFYAYGQTGIRSFDYATIAAPSTVDVLRADANGNIYVAGKYFGNASIDFSPYGTQAPLTDTGTTTDIYIAKYDAGGVLLWLRNAMNDQSTGMEVTDLEVDASGNVFVSGSVTGDAAKFYDATTNYDVSGGAASYTGAYVVKYSSSGAITWIWNKKHATTQYYAKGIEIDGGNIHVGGYTNDGDGNEVSLAVLNSAGAEQSYHTLATIANTVTVAAFDRDASGNYYFTGSTNKAVIPDAFVSKFNSSRVQQWISVVRNFATAGGSGGGFAERGVDIEVDGTGNVFALFNGSSDAFVTKYNSSGTLQSASFRLTANNGNTGRDLALDASGNVIIAGNLRGTTDFDPGSGTVNGGDSFGSYYLASYTSNLAYNWSRILNHNSQTSTRVSASADVDPFGKIHIAYHYDNTGFRKGLITTYSLAGDVTAPTATTLNPADNATNVALSASPQITFSESVSLVNGGTVTIRKQSNLTEFESFTIPSARLTLSGNTLTINPTSDFPLNNSVTSYYITISGGAVRDAAGNFFAPITTSNVWNFSTIVDSSGPALVTRTPAPGATGIDPTSNLSISFNENILAHTGGSITLQKLVSGAYTSVQTFTFPSGLVGISSTQATIDPTAILSYSSTYQVLVSSNAFKDAAGNYFAGQTAGAWTFSTMEAPDAVAPTVASYSPADNAATASINADLTLTFSENITGVSSKVINLFQTSGTTLIESFTLPSAKVQISGNAVTINPTMNLAYNTAYHVTVEAGAFEDAAGNDFAGFTNNTTWNFTTQADPSDLAPFLTSLTPANGATGVNRRTTLQGFFSESVTLGTSKALEIRRVSDNSVVEAFTTASPGISLEGGLVITPTNDLPGSTALYVYFEGGFVQDGNSNPMAAVSSSSTWSFTTAAADVAGPALSSTDPVNGEVNVSDERSAIHLQFNENVFINTGTITISGSGFNETIDVSESENIETESDGLIVLYLVGQLPDNTAITVSAPAGVFTDEWGNNSPSFSFSFTTEEAPDEAAPTVNTYFPAIGEAGVPFQRWLSLTFNEAVQFAPTADKYLRIYNSSDVLVDEVLVVSGSFSTIASGTILRLYYQKNLEFGVQHYATLDAGAVKDMSGNDFAGIAASTWHFTVESEAGALSRYSNFVPAKNATGVDNSLDQLSFNLFFPNKQGGTIALRKVSDDGLVKEWAVTDAEITLTGGGFTVNATNIPELEYNTEYYVELTGTSFSADGELSWGAFYAPDYVQYLNWNDDDTFWRFTTEAEPDTQEPTVVSISPVDDATDVGIDTDLVVTFSENIVANNGLITIKNLEGNNINQSFNVNGGVTIVDNILTIEPTIDLDYNTEYYVDFGVGVVKDAANNTFGGLNGNPDWTFTTIAASDVTAPAITGLSPADNATNVAASSNLTVTFSENIIANAGLISIRLVSNNSLHSSYSVDAATIENNTLTLNPSFDLDASTEYYVDLGAGIVKDAAGNAFSGQDGNPDWTFTTAGTVDNTSPTISSLSPVNDGSGVALNSSLILTASEPLLLPLSGDILIKTGTSTVETIPFNDPSVSLSSNTLTISNALENLQNSTLYWVYITGVTDLAGNPLPETNAVTWRFTTAAAADVTAPTITSLSPADNAPGVVVGTDLTVTFSENIVANSGFVIIRKMDDNSTHSSYNIESAVTIEGASLAVELTSDLENDTEYYVDLSVGLVKDAAGNLFAGQNGNPNWTFTTEDAPDTQHPTLVSTMPAQSATDVSVSTTLSWTFSENIEINTGSYSTQVYKAGNIDNQTILLLSDQVVADGATVTVTLTEELDYNSQYFFDLHAGSVKDLNGNLLQSTNTVSFTTQGPPDTTSPEVTDRTPANDDELNPNNVSFGLTFDEPIAKGTGLIQIRTTNGGGVVYEYLASGAEVVADGNLWYLDAELDFSVAGGSYYWVIPSTAITDLAGNPFIGFDSADDWYFSTYETVSPIVTSFSPANGGTGMAKNNWEYTITFNEDVEIGTGSIGFYQYSNEGHVVAYLVSDIAEVNGNTATIDFNYNGTFNFSQHAELTKYYITIPATAFKDLSGNFYAGTENKDTWAFTVGDFTEPYLVSSDPEVDEEAVFANNSQIILELSETVMRGGANDIVINPGNHVIDPNASGVIEIDGNTVTINHGLSFEYGEEVTVTVYNDVFRDLGNNALPAIQFNFTIESSDLTPPTVSSFDPALNSTHSGINDNFLAYFSEGVSAVDGKKVEVRRYDNDEVLQSNTFPSDFISIGSGVLVITAESSWPEGTELYILIDNGAALDETGNEFAGIADKDTWKFTIAVPDTAGPQVVSTTPADGAVDVAIASLEIAIEFDEDISSGSDATVLSVSGYGDIDITEFEGASLSENYLYLNLSGLLPSETEITVTLPEGVVVDNVGNLSPEYIFGFTTEDNGKENQEIAFSEIAAKTYGDAAFDLEANSDSGLEVSFEVVSGPVTISGSTVTISGAGEATIKATQGGDDNYNAASPVERSFSIGKKAQSISFVEIPGNTYGDAAFNLEATSDSGLEVSFEVVSGTVTIAGSTVTITGAGEATIKATQAGDDNYNAASPVERSFSIGKKAQSISFVEIPGKTYGDAAFNLEATSDSGLEVSFEVVSGPVTIAGSTVTIAGAGEATIKATQAGNDIFNAASLVERSFSISKKAQTISVTSIEDKLTTDEAFEVEASVDSELELTYVISGPATLEGTSITLSGEEGTVMVTVSQAGNDNYLSTEASEIFEVTAPAVAEKQNQTITFSEIPGKTFGDAAFDLAATASSNLAVTFEVVSGPVTVSGKTLAITGAGQATIKATQVGNDEYNAAPAIERTLTIAKKAQVVTITPIDDKLTTDPAFDVVAMVNSDLALTYTVSGPATISGSAVTLNGEPGTITVTVVQAGNENYLSAEASEAFEVTTPAPSTFSISGSAITTANVAFSSGQARLHPKNGDGSFAAAITASLSGTGSFSFEGLLAGQYALSVTSTDNQILTTYYDGALSLADATIIEVSNGNVSGLSVAMEDKPLPPTGPGSIKGTLLLAADGGRKIVTGGRVMEGIPLAGVTIYLVNAANNDLIATTETAADGSFQFSNLPLGAYKLLVDYEGKTSIESPEIVITETSLGFDVASEVTEDGIVIVAEPTVTNGVAINQLSPLLTVYPNPSSGVVTLQWDGNTKDILEIIIHNNNGSAVWRGNLAADQQTVDISQHPSGVYFLRLITNKGTAIQKLVIK